MKKRKQSSINDKNVCMNELIFNVLDKPSCGPLSQVSVPNVTGDKGVMEGHVRGVSAISLVGADNSDTLQSLSCSKGSSTETQVSRLRSFSAS